MRGSAALTRIAVARSRSRKVHPSPATETNLRAAAAVAKWSRSKEERHDQSRDGGQTCGSGIGCAGAETPPARCDCCSLHWVRQRNSGRTALLCVSGAGCCAAREAGRGVVFCAAETGGPRARLHSHRSARRTGDAVCYAGKAGHRGVLSRPLVTALYPAGCRVSRSEAGRCSPLRRESRFK